MKKLIVLILCMFCASCASPGLPTSYEVMLDSSFTPDEIAVIEAGITSWYELGPDAPSFYFEVVPTFSLPHEKDVGWSTVVIHKTTVEWVRANGGQGNSLALTHTCDELSNEEDDNFNMAHDAIGSTAYYPGLDNLQEFIGNNDPKTYLFELSAHEIGHSAGLRHVNDPHKAIMNASLDDAPANGKPACDDLKQYCDIRHSICHCANPI